MQADTPVLAHPAWGAKGQSSFSRRDSGRSHAPEGTPDEGFVDWLVYLAIAISVLALEP